MSKLFEKDFEKKNMKAVLGISESDEDFAKNNKKAINKLKKTKYKKQYLGYVILFITLCYFYLLVTNNLGINAIKYLSGICIMLGIFFGIRLIHGGYL